MDRATADKRAYAPGKYWTSRARRLAGSPPAGRAGGTDRAGPRPAWLRARVAEYRRRAAAALRLLARGGDPESIFTAPLPDECYPPAGCRAA